MLNAIGEAVLSTDQSGHVTYLNPIAETLTGWSAREAAGRPLCEVLHIVDSGTREVAAGPVAEAIGFGCLLPLATPVLRRRDGSEVPIEQIVTPIRDAHGRVTGDVIVVRDVSAATATSRRMSYLAGHDPLTDLPNRLFLGDRLAHGLALAQRHQRRLAVLFLDIDHFKSINDSYGHARGDELLRSIGRQLASCVRSSDTVSRYGGDEFVVVLSELERPEDAAAGAQTIRAAVARPYTIGGQQLRVTVTVGISVYPEDGEDAETLITSADMALYQAKHDGRDGYRFFLSACGARASAGQPADAESRIAAGARRNTAT